MKFIISYSVVFFCFLSILHAQSQCKTCDISLAKDYLQSSSSSQRQLNVLKIIDQEKFEQVKKESKSGSAFGLDVFGILSSTFDNSKTYQEFVDNRERVFKSFGYNLSEAQAQAELRIVTNDIAYTAWSACIEKCFEADKTKAYAWIADADATNILVNAKYKSGQATDVAEISCTIEVSNGMVEQITSKDKPIYKRSVRFSLGKNSSVPFTIRRKNPREKTTIKIYSTTEVMMNEFSQVSDKSHLRLK